MASLRRLASLDRLPNPSSNPASPHLIRHSSLPNNLFLCQPELAIGAPNRHSPLHKASLFINECRSVPIASRLALVCRALSSSQYIDDIPEFERPCGTAQGRFDPRPSGNVRRLCTPYASNKKEAIVADGLDLEKSVVYSELRESVCSWEVPPTFFKPYDIGVKVFAQNSTPIHTLHKPCENKSQTISDLCMPKSGGDQNDVKDRPMSLRMLKRKRKQAKVTPHTDSDEQCKPKDQLVEKSCASHCGASTPVLNATGVGDSVFSVFASLLYMLKMLQQHAALSPCMQSHASGADAADEIFRQNWVGRAYAEMLDTFLWLFQQVFSCTPKLMLLTVMLLADFTLHSVSKHVALPVMPLGEPPPATTLLYYMTNSTIMGSVGAMSHSADEEQHFVITKKQNGFKEGFFILPSEHEGEASGGTVRVLKHGGSYSDGNGDSSPLRTMTLDSSVTTVNGDDVGAGISASSSQTSLLSHHVANIKGIDLDTRTKNMLVAPVRAPALEADDYPCFDRTDLTYQQEISMDPSNPLLLANYAQFLHVVRHDNGRAEKLYRRAVMVDPDNDGEVVGRFANFLWVVKGDVVEAESAYKAAVVADPSNVYHAGCYAHFMWSSSACQAEETSCCSTMDNLGINS